MTHNVFDGTLNLAQPQPQPQPALMRSVIYVKSLRDCNPDAVADDVTRQLLKQVGGGDGRVGVQWTDAVMTMVLGCGDDRTPAAVADHVTLPVDSHHGPAARYVYPARHQLTSPRRARSNKTLVVVAHQFVELGIAHLYDSIPAQPRP